MPPALRQDLRLLPQPGGFEGFGAFDKALNPNHLVAPEGPEREVTDVDWKAALASHSALMHLRQDAAPAGTSSSASIVRSLTVPSKPLVYSATPSVPKYAPSSRNPGRKTRTT
jgi:hypothetical protein